MIFFRASSVSNAIEIIKNMFVLNFASLSKELIVSSLGMDLYDFAILIISLTILLIVKLIARKGNIREKLFEQNIIFRWGVIYILIVVIITFGCYGVGYNPISFIYEQF